MINKEIIRNDGNLYIILRKIPIHNFKERKTETINLELVNAYKEHLRADQVLRRDDTFLFCETVPDAEIINE